MSAPTTDQIQSVVTFLTKAAFHLSAAPTNTSKSSFSSSQAPFGKTYANGPQRYFIREDQ